MVLHVFDMDGTLLVGSACLEISRAVGALEETIAIEEEWARGEISDNGFWVRCLPLWNGITDEQIDRAFTRSAWLAGVKETFTDIRDRNEYSVVISQSPKFFFERIQRWGLNYAYGALVRPGNAEGAEKLVSSENKLEITDTLLSQLGLNRRQCVAYGDSSSDIALFRALESTVAVNAKKEIQDLAQAKYSGPSIWEAYEAGRQLLDR